ncbi:MAG: alpha/beta fold hydrolase [Pseudomonadota bacterium]
MANNRIGEIRGSVKLAGKTFEHLTSRIHEFHRAISDMPFNAMPAVPGVKDGSEGTRAIHDGITDGVYGVIKGIGGALFKQADVALKLAERNFQPATQTAAAITPPAIARDNLVSAISGLIGDAMSQERNPLRVKLGFYREGHRTSLSAPVLAATYPEATGKLVVFIHGLCCNEHSWRLYAEQHTPYGDQLAAKGYTPLYVRYNSGLHISLNGRTLARQIDKLVSLWPVPVTEVVLIGHSMGGLVARSAAYKAAKSNMTWPAKVSHILCLGTPHTGAPLEQFVHAATPVLEAFPLSRPLAKVLAVRSEGIRDLRHGFVADEHWKKRTTEERTADARTEIPRIASVKYHFIGSSIGLDEHHWLGKAIGDGLVKLPSSTARELADADTATLYSAHHMQLLNHPAIYKEIAQRLGKKAIKE